MDGETAVNFTPCGTADVSGQHGNSIQRARTHAQTQYIYIAYDNITYLLIEQTNAITRMHINNTHEKDICSQTNSYSAR